MIRHLFILISLCSWANASDKNEYLTIKGDTLWSISRNFNISINELIEINSFKSFKSGIPILNIDQAIKISRSAQDDVANYCYSDRTFDGINFSKKLKKDKIILGCIEYLQNALDPYVIGEIRKITDFDSPNKDSKFINKRFWGEKKSPSLDEKFWDIYFSDKRYSYFFYNIYFSETESAQELSNEIMLRAALMGDATSIEYVGEYAQMFFGNYKNIHNADSFEDFIDSLFKNTHSEIKRLNKKLYFKLGTDKENSYKNFILYDLELLDHEGKAEFYFTMLSALYKAGDIAFYRFEQEAFKFLGQSKSKLISWNEFAVAINMMYMNLNLNNEERVLDIYQIIKDRTEINDVADLYNRATKNIIYENEGRGIGMVLTFILNVDSAFYDVYPNRYKHEDLISRRQALMNYVFAAKERQNIEDVDIAAWHSDTGLKLARNGECLEAAYFLEKAFSIYEDFPDKKRTDDFGEPIELASCHNRNGNFEASKKLLKLAYKNLDSYVYDQSFYNGLIGIKYTEISISEGNYLNAFTDFKESMDIFFRNESKFGSTMPLNLLEDFINTYIKIYYQFKDKGYNLSNIKTPNQVIGLSDRLQTRKRLEQLKIDDSKTNIVNLKNNLKENKDKISLYEDLLENKISQEIYSKLDSLYSDRKKIINKMLKKNNGIKALFNPSNKEYVNIKENIDKDSVLLSYFVGSNEILILVTEKGIDRIYSVKNSSKRDINFMISELRRSMNDVNQLFAYKESLELYNILIRPIKNIIKNKETIYLYGSGLENLPFGVLISDYNKAVEISEYQRLVSSDWLIKHHSFARIFPLSNNKINSSFENKFLGFANPSSLEELGLPILPNSEIEIRDLSLATGDFDKKFLLTKNNASKKNLKIKLEDSFERIVFATHSVPAGWKGLTTESALVLDDKNGDFLLTATEIVDLDIKSDIIVLSSCNTDQKGSDSLYKSFLIAGANSVMYSNWDLETLSAAVITDKVFKSILYEASPKHQALQKASISIMNDYSNKSYAHPAFWGNFSIAYRNL